MKINGEDVTEEGQLFTEATFISETETPAQ
jgi:hypothetical protein